MNKTFSLFFAYSSGNFIISRLEITVTNRNRDDFVKDVQKLTFRRGKFCNIIEEY